MRRVNGSCKTQRKMWLANLTKISCLTDVIYDLEKPFITAISGELQSMG